MSNPERKGKVTVLITMQDAAKYDRPTGFVRALTDRIVQQMRNRLDRHVSEGLLTPEERRRIVCREQLWQDYPI